MASENDTRKWQSLETAPMNRAVEVMASLRPGEWENRKVVAYQKFENYWFLYGRERLRTFPIAWREIDLNEIQNEIRE